MRKALPRITASADELQRRMQSERDLKHMTHAHIRFLLRGCMTLLFFSTLTAQAHAATYYVAQNGGSDSNAGSPSAPFQTIQKCASVAVSGDSCLVRAGTYRETVKPANNGVTFAPDGNVSVTVSGADVVSGWTAYQGNIYKSSGMTWDLGVNYNQVFLDGQMMNLARWPNTSLDVSHPTWAKAEGGFPTVESDSDVPWGIDDSHLTQSDGFWDGAEITQMSADYYAQGGVVTAYSIGHVDWRSLNGVQSRGTIKSGVRYFLSNKLGALDTGGEWYYGSNTLYLWTPNSDNPSSHTVEAKRRMFAFDLNGRSNTTIKGFNIFAASIDMDTSSSGNVIDGINAKYVWHQTRNVPVGISTMDSKWGAWNTGIRLAGSNNVLKNCTIAFSSNNGVYVRNTHQTVTNCTIHDIAYGKVEGGAVSWMGDDGYGSNTQGHEVTYNTMYTSGRAIVNHYYAPNIKIQHNLMYDACIQTADCGITYTNKGGSSGDISYNILHDDHADFYAYALYLDDGSENYTVHHNVIYDSDNCGITNNGASSDLLYNNTLYNTPWGICNNVTGDNNIVNNDPGFVNVSGHDFHLRSGSSAIDAGKVISGITNGYVGSAPDIGAYEYGVADWTAGANITRPQLLPPSAFRVVP